MHQARYISRDLHAIYISLSVLVTYYVIHTAIDRPDQMGSGDGWDGMKYSLLAVRQDNESECAIPAEQGKKNVDSSYQGSSR